MEGWSLHQPVSCRELSSTLTIQLWQDGGRWCSSGPSGVEPWLHLCREAPPPPEGSTCQRKHNYLQHRGAHLRGGGRAGRCFTGTSSVPPGWCSHQRSRPDPPPMRAAAALIAVPCVFFQSFLVPKCDVWPGRPEKPHFRGPTSASCWR